MRKVDHLNVQSRNKAFKFGMAVETLAVIAVRLALSGYILAIVVYVNASGNWDRDDDPGLQFIPSDRSRLL